MTFASLLFYLFAGVLLLSAAMVVSARNPVHSVLFLILSFFNAAALFLLIGAEYIAMTLIIVYVGAVAVLFLFVVMMLDINIAELRQGFLRYLPVGASVSLVLVAELAMLFYHSLTHASFKAVPAKPLLKDGSISNTEALGNILYTDFVYPFQLSGLVLLVAMIGAIVLTYRRRPGVRRQNIGQQVSRRRSEGVKLVQVKPGEGI